jgi:hypothetical protein
MYIHSFTLSDVLIRNKLKFALTLFISDVLVTDMSPAENIKIVRRAIEAFNTGNTSDVHLFIGPDYIDRESQSHKDSYRSKLKGPEEFVDTIKNLRSAFQEQIVFPFV